MKNIFTSLFLITGIFSFGQKTDSANYKFPRNEIKVNALYPFVNGAEFSYERHLTNHSSIGTSVFFELENFGDSFMISPYYRYYFGKKVPNSGFFLEGNMMVSSSKNDFHNAISEKGNVMPGLGIQTGYKLHIKNNWFVEANAGVGFLIRNSNFEARELFRGGILLGKRF